MKAGVGGNRSNSDDIFAGIRRGEALRALASDRPPGIGYDPKV